MDGMDAMDADAVTVFIVGTTQDIIYRRLIGERHSALQFRQDFLGTGYGFFAPTGSDRTVFSGFLDERQTASYYAHFYSNQKKVVHLSIVTYDTEKVRMTEKIDVLWDMSNDIIQAYADPYHAAESWDMLRFLFPFAVLTPATFTTLSNHYRIPDLSDYNDGVQLATFSFTDAPPSPPVAQAVQGAQGAPTAAPTPYIHAACFPYFTDPTFIFHYAALCKYGWFHTKICPFDFEYSVILTATAAEYMLVLGDKQTSATISYGSCTARVANQSYDHESSVLSLSITGSFSDPAVSKGAPSFITGKPPTPVFSVHLCWNLTHNVLYFPTGHLSSSTILRLPKDTFLMSSWVTSPKCFLEFLENLFIANVPRILWNGTFAIRLAREIINGLPWLTAFREATRDRLPETFYHALGMAEVPKDIRAAHQITEILPEASLPPPPPAKRTKSSAPTSAHTSRDPRPPRPCPHRLQVITGWA